MDKISCVKTHYKTNGYRINSNITQSLSRLIPLRFILISSARQNTLWNKLVDQYHYLKYSKIPGKRLKYFIFSHDYKLLALIGWKSGSYRLIKRDMFIGWSPSCREKNIDHIVTNIRFIIFPWVRVKNLASLILARSIKHVKKDWKKKYNKEIYLAETFIDPIKFTGASYKAANWKSLGLTKGYSKVKGGYVYHGNKKEIFVYVIKKDFRKALHITSPWIQKNKQTMSVLKRLMEVRAMTFQDLDFNPDLIDNELWSDDLFEKIAEELRDYYYQFYNCFSHKNQIIYGQLYIHGLLSPLERKHMEGIALHLEGPKKVRGLQKFMKDSPWDHQLMHRTYLDMVAKQLSSCNAMLTIDSSENAKKGTESVGVSRQYCGNTGKLDNCQSGVFLGYASNNGYTLLDGRLYLPEKWFSAQYSQKRKECGVPDDIEFKTKLEISIEMLKNEIEQNRFMGKWVGADAFFGSSNQWCKQIEEAGLTYLCAIRKNQLFWTKKPEIISVKSYEANLKTENRVMQTDIKPESVEDIIKHMDVKWEKVILAEGTKGPIAAEVAILRVFRNEDNLSLKELWLIVRKDSDGSLHYYISNALENIKKEELHHVLTMRWSIEQCFEDGKKYLGMDHYEHRSWSAWHRHMLFVFLAMFFLHNLRIKLKKNPIEYITSDEAFNSGNINGADVYKRKNNYVGKVLS